QSIGGDIERDAQKHVGRALIELTRQSALGDIELKEAVAWRQGHAVYLDRIPRRDDQSARIRIAPDRVDQVSQLVDGCAIGRRPGAPLPPIDRPKIALLIRPFVPYRHAMVIEIFDNCLACTEIMTATNTTRWYSNMPCGDKLKQKRRRRAAATSFHEDLIAPTAYFRQSRDDEHDDRGDEQAGGDRAREEHRYIAARD